MPHFRSWDSQRDTIIWSNPDPGIEGGTITHSSAGIFSNLFINVHVQAGNTNYQARSEDTTGNQEIPAGEYFSLLLLSHVFVVLQVA